MGPILFNITGMNTGPGIERGLYQTTSERKLVAGAAQQNRPMEGESTMLAIYRRHENTGRKLTGSS
jgi:hypothetical protein